MDTLFTSITPEAIAAAKRPTDVIIIGCGEPDLLDSYNKTVKNPYTLYTEPTGKIYEELGMIKKNELGPARPDYQKQSLPKAILTSMWQGLRHASNITRGGNPWQIGGAFIFRGEEVVFNHRMATMRDFAGVDTLRRELGINP